MANDGERDTGINSIEIPKQTADRIDYLNVATNALQLVLEPKVKVPV